jgi:hypothetical protein
LRRIVALGGSGFFGRKAISLLRDCGARPLVASRRSGADLRIDADDPSLLRESLRSGDVVVDTAGPFQSRSMALIEAAIDIGFDVVDLSDSLDYALRMGALAPRIEQARIRVLTSCSSLSTVVASQVQSSGMRSPVNISVCLAPASRMAATAGTGASLSSSVGSPIRILREGRLVDAVGWSVSRSFDMPAPIGAARGYLTESVDAVTLPAVWPSLRGISFWIDSRVPGLNMFLSLGGTLAPFRRVLGTVNRYGAPLARLLGSTAGGMLVDIEGDGRRYRATLFAPRRSYLIALAPLVLATRAIAEERFTACGLVRHDRQVDPKELTDYLRDLGIEIHHEARGA